MDRDDRSEGNLPRVATHVRPERKVNFEDLSLGRRIGFLWNFIIPGNRACRAMISLKRPSSKWRPKRSC
jgi:hypothetical protein